MAEEASRAGEFLIIPVLGAEPGHFDVVSLLREAALAGAFIAGICSLSFRAASAIKNDYKLWVNKF